MRSVCRVYYEWRVLRTASCGAGDNDARSDVCQLMAVVLWVDFGAAKKQPKYDNMNMSIWRKIAS